MSKAKRNFLIVILFAVLFTLAVPHVKANAASSKKMVKAYRTYVAKHKKTIKNYNIVYIGGGPALVANLWWMDYNTNRQTYTLHNKMSYDQYGVPTGMGYTGCDVYYYKKGKVRRIGEASATGGYRLVYLKNYGLIAKGDTIGTSTPWRYYIKKGKLYNKYTSQSKYKWKNHLLLAKKNK